MSTRKALGKPCRQLGLSPGRRHTIPIPMNMPDSRDMPSPSPRPVIVVLGSGRSGTSLLMQALAALGMGLSEDMIEARRDNPEGFFEDARIVKIQADLLRGLKAWPYHPLPTDWLTRPETRAAEEKLRTLLREHAAQSGIWGFKDPRTASFLPLWQRLFQEEGIAPKYILALREPGSIIHSFMQAYATPAEIAELVWLRRTCDALWHTQGECHIVHYEDWFSRAAEVVAGLAQVTGLPALGKDALHALVKPDLDRAGQGDYDLGNADAQSLHAALKTCRGNDFDRERLLQTVATCLKGLEARLA